VPYNNKLTNKGRREGCKQLFWSSKYIGILKRGKVYGILELEGCSKPLSRDKQSRDFLSKVPTSTICFKAPVSSI